MGNFENDAHGSSENATGIVKDQFVGALNMHTSPQNSLGTPKGDGLPILDDTGQNSVSTDGQDIRVVSRKNANDGTTDISSRDTSGQNVVMGKHDSGQNVSNNTGNAANESTRRDGQIDKGCVNAIGQNCQDSNKKMHELSSGNAKGKGKQSFASLFKDNRAPSEASRLTFVEPPVGKLVLGIDEIDSVEKAFGFCLVGYVMGPRPSPYALLNYVKSWGNEVKFTFKENGWIRFQFPNEEVRDKVLNGGPYMIFGRQLFLKKLPSCFLFSKEDMVFFPSWVQIFGLPADCWTTQALSRIASVVGKPLHTDMLTISKKGANYARILVELDAKKPRVREYSVELPTGKEISIKFKYEFDPKFCNKCESLGHSSELCGIPRGKVKQMQPTQKAPVQGNTPIDNKTECVTIGESSGTKSGKDKGVDSGHSSQLHYTLGDACLPDPDEALPDVGLEEDGVGVDDGNSVDGSGMSSPRADDLDMDSDVLIDLLSRVVTQDKDEWKTVKGRKKNKSRKKISKQECVGKSGYNVNMGKFFEGIETESSCDTEYVPCGDAILKGRNERFFGKKKAYEVRPPDTASGCP